MGGCLPSSCPLGAEVGRAFGDSGPAGCWRWSSNGALPAFWSLYCSSLGALLTNVALFRVFRAFLAGYWGFLVGLYCFGGLRGLCGFLCACGVRRIKGFRRIASIFFLFAFVFLPLCLRFSYSPIFWGFAFVVLLHCLCCFFFPYGLYAKRKGAKVFAPCVLSSCVVG